MDLVIPGYTPTQLLFRGKTEVYRCRRALDGLPLIAKIAGDSAGTEAMERLRREYALLLRLRAAGNPAIVEPVHLLERPASTVMFMYDAGGTDLRRYIAGNARLPLRDVLHIGRQIAGALASLHAARVMHRDVNPGNIIFNPDTQAVQLIDFDLSMSTDEPKTAQMLEGTLPYIAPEQTGRTNAALDQRADLYGLGATLYALLANAPPFANGTTSDLLLAILTGYPPAIDGVPDVINDMLARLMRKAPGERYASAHGLGADLGRALDALGDDSTIASFTLGAQDRSERLEIGHALYGREAETARLLEVFHKISLGGTQLILLRGVAGSGKSALTYAIEPQLSGFFAVGKFDQLRRHVPLNALSQAIDSVVHQILMLNETPLENWRTKVQASLGTFGQALVEVAPSLELLVGKQRPIAALPPFQTENRLLALIQRLLRTLCEEQPLTLFFDDLQWADSGTLRLLENLTRESNTYPHLLIIASVREEEVQGQLQLADWLGTLDEQTASVTQIHLSPLGPESVGAFLRDTLQVPDVAALSQVVVEKTGGNCLAVAEFLKHLWHIDLLTYDHAAKCWQWDLPGIRALPVFTDNVVELLTGTLSSLPAATQTLLRAAACLGDQFHLGTLAAALNVPEPQARLDLWHAVEAGLLIDLRRDAHGIVYKFAHDRVQQACHAQLDAAALAAVNYRIGTLLRSRYREQQDSSTLFSALNHLNRCHHLITDGSERLELAQLNHRAGREALLATAYTLARDYLMHAHALMDSTPNDDVVLQRRITLDLAESEYLSGDSQTADERLKVLSAAITDVFEKVEVFRRRVLALWAAGEYDEALQIGLDGLNLLGMRLPAKASSLNVLTRLLRVRFALRKHDDASLRALPTMTNRRVQILLEYLASLLTLSFFTGRNNLFAVIILEMLGLTLTHGRTALSPSLLAMGGLLFMSAFREVDVANRLTNTAQALAADSEVALPGLLALATVSTSLHFHLSAEELAQVSAEGAQRGLQAGDFINTVPLVQGTLADYFSQSMAKAVAYCNDMRDIVSHRDSTAAAGMHVLRQYVRCMHGLTDGPTSFSDAEYSEANDVAHYRKLKSPFPWLIYNIEKLTTTVTMRNFAEAELAVKRLLAHPSLPLMRGNVGMVQISFFVCLFYSQTALHHGGNRLLARWRMRRWRAQVAWYAMVGPKPYAGILDVIDAERAALAGQTGRALALYERGLAQQTDRHLFGAIGHECAARYCTSLGAPRAAEAYMQVAYARYSVWGAVPKGAQLDLEFPFLKLQYTRVTEVGHGTVRTTTERHSERFNVAALINTSQAMAQEINLQKLMHMLLHEVLVQAGGDLCVLLLRDGRALKVRAMQTREGNTATGDDALATQSVPTRLLKYVELSAQAVLLRVGDRNKLWDDPYFATQPAQAVVCAPLMRRGILQGIVYVENHAATSAFNPDSLTMVELIAAQGAVSLQNAELYAEMESKVQARGDQLAVAQQRLVKLERVASEIQMAGGFAHEMRNALYSAQTILDYLLQDDSTWNHDEAASALGAISQSIERGIRLTKQVLEYARVGEIVPDPSPTAAASVVERVLEEMHDSLQQLHIDVKHDISPEVQVAMKADHLYSVVHNLIGNARDALATRDGTRRIDVTLDSSTDAVKLHIHDTAGGIPATVRDRLFQPFVSTKGSQGAGLGLGMVKKLVDSYSGKIEVETADEQGTTFHLSLPGVRPGTP